MPKEPEKHKVDYKKIEYDIMTAYRRITWRIWLYLKANPDILASNNNGEVLNEVARIQTNIYLRDNAGLTYEKAFETQDFVSDLMAKGSAVEYFFDQDLLDLFRPGVEHDQGWRTKMFWELFFFSINPEGYTKTIHEMVLEEDKESN